MNQLLPSPVIRLPNIQVLDVSFNELSDVSAIESLQGCAKLETIRIDGALSTVAV